MARWALVCCAMLVTAVGCSQPQPESLTARGEAAHLAGNYDEAIRLCTEAIAANPNDASAYLCRGQAYHFRNQPGDNERALADYGDAIKINPRVPEPYYRRSLVYRDMGKSDLELADVQRARSSDPSVQDSYNKLPDTTLPTPKLKVPKLDEPTAKTERKDDTPIGSSGGAPGSLEVEERRDYDRLKRKFESHDPFGRLTTRRREPIAPAPSPFAAPPTTETKSPVAESTPAKPGAAATTGASAAANRVQPPPSSPFMPRPSYEPSAALPVREGPRSPFPQVPSSPTGRFPEQTGNPFAPQQQRQYFPTPFSRPNNGPISNPAVRNLP